MPLGQICIQEKILPLGIKRMPNRQNLHPGENPASRHKVSASRHKVSASRENLHPGENPASRDKVDA